ncbi:NAD(P)H-binding protein [Sphingobium vermicomposti]|nr:NAD(P)H-binding protein [Sphingobium vermicomposti]
MKIGISGAGGHLGTAVLKRLRELSGEHEVVGISRSPQSVQYADEARFGDYDAQGSLREAYLGLDRLLIIPTLDLRYGARARQLVHAVDAALSAGVGHIILISDIGTREEPEPHIGAASWVGEQRLIKSAPRWTILRANYFMESFAREVALSTVTGRMAELGDGRVAFVSRDDVAAAAAAILVGTGHSGAIYNATGTEALSIADRAHLIEQVAGKPINVIQTSMEELRQELELAQIPEEYLALALEIKRKTSEGVYDLVTGDVERLSGRRPISLGDVLKNYLVESAL